VKAHYLHDWRVTSDQARQIQKRLAGQVDCRSDVDDVRMIAGVDISGPGSQGLAQGAVVVLSYPELELVETRTVEKELTFPYVPGLLSFREAPLVLSACEQLDVIPDLVMVDGQGIAHPRRLGLAAHLGLLWNRPTIGCAKSRLCREHENVCSEPNTWTELVDDGEVVGAVLRTRTGASPLYVSIGHKVDLETAVSWVLRCCRSRRLPEPLRLAHLAASGKLAALRCE